jgi:hypothetical protein
MVNEPFSPPRTRLRTASLSGAPLFGRQSNLARVRIATQPTALPRLTHGALSSIRSPPNRDDYDGLGQGH